MDSEIRGLAQSLGADMKAALRGRYTSVTTVTAATYTPTLADEGRLILLDRASAITVTLPSDAALAMPVGATIDFLVINTGLATFAPGAGATVDGTPSLTTRAQWSAVTAIKRAASSWVVVGDLG